jgi:tRNA dimethylallyltransferase
MIFIGGPTSSGKTSLAINICKKFNGEIVSADSRQVYKHFDVGTGKTPVGGNVEVLKNDFSWEIDGVKIWLYDVADPLKDYSVVDFKRDAQIAMNDIRSRGKMPVVVGGTGFYIDSLLGYEIDVNIPQNKILRDSLKDKSVQELQQMLPSAVKNELNNSELNNPARLIRKIEILEAGGEIKLKDSFISALEKDLIVLTRSREEMYVRSDKWVDLIWQPLLVEVTKLLDIGYKDSTIMKGLIYNTALSFIQGEIAQTDAIQKIKYDIHAYIRRQETWFKKYKEAKFINPAEKSFDVVIESM